MGSTQLVEALCSTNTPECKTFPVFPGWPEPWPLSLTPKNLNSSITLGVRATECKGLRNSHTENRFWVCAKLEFMDFVGWPQFCIRRSAVQESTARGICQTNHIPEVPFPFLSFFL